VDQGIDRDKLDTDLEPPGAIVSSADQDPGQRHRQHLVRYPVNLDSSVLPGFLHLVAFPVRLPNQLRHQRLLQFVPRAPYTAEFKGGASPNKFM
jgi:hypothetical protein